MSDSVEKEGRKWMDKMSAGCSREMDKKKAAVEREVAAAIARQMAMANARERSSPPLPLLAKPKR